MEELATETTKLQQEVSSAAERLKIDDLSAKLSHLQASSQQPDFWSDNQKASSTMQDISNLEAKVSPWLNLKKEISDLAELVTLKDASMETELKKQLRQLKKIFDSLKEELKFSGPYDDHNAILSIHAGAGGTDAQDWTQMLFRMYTRWAEKSGYSIAVVEESPGEEAGLKSVMAEIKGAYVYGKLKGEHGVHRLVRLSPFNSDNLRQTSFAKVEVAPMIDSPEEVKIDEKDLKIDVYRAGGHGGQSVNTTDSAVRITHTPTGISVAIQNERSQVQNKETAMTILRSRLAQLQMEQHKEHLEELKGPNVSAEWGNQIRSYVLHPYKQVKDLRTRYETSDPEAVLDGDLNDLISSYLEKNIG